MDRLRTWGIWAVLAAAAGSVPAGAGELRRIGLENGLEVVLAPGHPAPVTTTVLAYRVGSGREQPGQTGISHLLEHMMFKGTERLPRGEIDLISQAGGGSNNAYTWLDSTLYFFTLPLDGWRQALAIEADRMRRCRFDPAELAAEQAVVLEEQLTYRDLPAEALSEAVLAAALPGHPYGRPVLGSAADVAAVTPASLRAYYDRFYQPDNAVLLMAGDFDPEAALAEIRRLFGPLPPGSPRAPARAEARAPAPPRPDGPVELRLVRPAEAPSLQAAYPAPSGRDPDWLALDLARAVLCDGWSARLVQALVHDAALASDVSGSLAETASPFVLSLFVQLRPGADPAAALAILDRELDRFRRDGPEDWELAKVRRQYEAWLQLDLQRSEQQALILAEAALLETPDRPRRLVEAARGLSGRDLRRAARKYLAPERRVLGILEPAAAEARGAESEAALEPAAAEGAALPEPAGPPEPALAESAPPAAPALPGGRPIAPLADPPLAPLAVRRYTLAGGPSCALLATPGSGAVSLRAVIEAGSRLDPAGASGLAALTAACLRRGTSMHTEEELSRLLETRAIRLSAGADRAAAVVSLDCLPEDLELAVGILADLLQRPTLPAHQIQRQRDLTVAGLRSAEDDPAQAGSWRFELLAYEGDVLGRPPQGLVEEVERLDRSEVAEFHRRFYRPERIRITVAGDRPAEEIAAALAGRLADWPAAGPSQADLPAPPERLEVPRVLLHPMPREQAHIFLGHRGVARSSPDYAALLFVDQILGDSGGLADRLNVRLREEAGLAYTVTARIGGAAGILPGLFQAYIATSPENTRAAIEAIAAEIRHLQSGPIEPEELARARNALIGSLAFSHETTGDLAGYIWLTEALGRSDDYRRELAAELAAVTAADVQRAARVHLRPDALRLVVSGALDEAGLAAAGIAPGGGEPLWSGNREP